MAEKCRRSNEKKKEIDGMDEPSWERWMDARGVFMVGTGELKRICIKSVKHVSNKVLQE